MSNQLFQNYNTAKIFGFGKRTEVASYVNDSYDTVELAAGTLMGRVAATNKVVPLTSGASDGSQIPLGFVLNNHSVEAGDTVDIALVVAGDVVEGLITLQGSDTLNTVISGRTLRDRILGDTMGILLKSTDELTGFDNA
jgi:hypothetical protein